jgi:hypothetical protein
MIPASKARRWPNCSRCSSPAILPPCAMKSSGMHVGAVGQLIPVAERELFGDGPRPEGWDKP